MDRETMLHWLGEARDEFRRDAREYYLKRQRERYKCLTQAVEEAIEILGGEAEKSEG